MEKKDYYLFPDTNFNTLKEDRFLSTITKVNKFVEEGLGLPFTDFLKEFINLYGDNLIINGNQIIVPSIDQCVRNLFAHKLSSEWSSYKPVSLSYAFDSFKIGNPEKLSYLFPITFGKNEIKISKLLEDDLSSIDNKSLNSIYVKGKKLDEYWKEQILSYKGFNVDYPDIGVFWDRITRMILEAKKERINKGNNNLLVDIKLTYKGKNYFCSFSKKKNAYSTRKINGLADYLSIDDILNNPDIKLALPARLYYPYVYLPLSLFLRNFIIDYELDQTGLLDTKLVKKFFEIIGGRLGLIDLGSFYKGTLIESEKFTSLIKSLLGDLASGIEDYNWLSLSTIITPDIYNKVFNGLEEIKLSTPNKTSRDILNAIAEELESVLLR